MASPSSPNLSRCITDGGRSFRILAVLEAAVNGRAHALVTFNRRDYGEVPESFGVKVLSPAEVLRRIRG